jgi:hypothetical protein
MLILGYRSDFGIAPPNIILPLLISSSLLADLWVKDTRLCFVGQALRPYRVMTPVDSVCHDFTGFYELFDMPATLLSLFAKSRPKHAHRDLSIFSSFPTDKCQDNTSLCHGHILPNPFQVIIHLSP